MLGGVARHLHRSRTTSSAPDELTASSQAWGLDLCLGCCSEMPGGKANVREMIEFFGPEGPHPLRPLPRRAGHRARTSPSASSARATTIPAEVMVLLSSSGFTGFLLDDHVPHMDDDTDWNHRGRAHAIGYMQGLLRMGERPRGGVVSAVGAGGRGPSTRSVPIGDPHCTGMRSADLFALAGRPATGHEHGHALHLWNGHPQPGLDDFRLVLAEHGGKELLLQLLKVAGLGGNTGAGPRRPIGAVLAACLDRGDFCRSGKAVVEATTNPAETRPRRRKCMIHPRSLFRDSPEAPQLTRTLANFPMCWQVRLAARAMGAARHCPLAGSLLSANLDSAAADNAWLASRARFPLSLLPPTTPVVTVWMSPLPMVTSAGSDIKPLREWQWTSCPYHRCPQAPRPDFIGPGSNLTIPMLNMLFMI